jgi:hypothetical protein
MWRPAHGKYGTMHILQIISFGTFSADIRPVAQTILFYQKSTVLIFLGRFEYV